MRAGTEQIDMVAQPCRFVAMTDAGSRNGQAGSALTATPSVLAEQLGSHWGKALRAQHLSRALHAQHLSEKQHLHKPS